MQERRSSSWGAPWWPPPRTLQTASKASVISSMTSAGRPEEDDVTEVSKNRCCGVGELQIGHALLSYGLARRPCRAAAVCRQESLSGSASRARVMNAWA